MKVLKLLAIPFLLAGCVITDDGIALNPTSTSGLRLFERCNR